MRLQVEVHAHGSLNKVDALIREVKGRILDEALELGGTGVVYGHVEYEELASGVHVWCLGRVLGEEGSVEVSLLREALTCSIPGTGVRAETSISSFLKYYRRNAE